MLQPSSQEPGTLAAGAVGREVCSPPTSLGLLQHPPRLPASRTTVLRALRSPAVLQVRILQCALQGTRTGVSASRYSGEDWPIPSTQNHP